MKWLIDKHTAGKPINLIRAILKDKNTITIQINYYDETFKGEIKKINGSG